MYLVTLYNGNSTSTWESLGATGAKFTQENCKPMTQRAIKITKTPNYCSIDSMFFHAFIEDILSPNSSNIFYNRIHNQKCVRTAINEPEADALGHYKTFGGRIS